jgi:hypothetical protein
VRGLIPFGILIAVVAATTGHRGRTRSALPHMPLIALFYRGVLPSARQP